MATASQKKRGLYEQLLALSDNVVGEIINGELVVSPRPSGPAIVAASFLGDELVGPFSKGRGGPGGWWILDEPEIEFEHESQHYVPDLAGWRRERMPEVPSGHIFTVVPDWVCEVVSPSSRRYDRIEKPAVYARHAVGHYWVIDPEAQTLEAFQLEGSNWLRIGGYSQAEKVRVAPFEVIEIDLSLLWPTPPGPPT